MNKIRIKASEHMIERCKQSGYSHFIIINKIPKNIPIKGQLRWRIPEGILILEKVNPKLIIVKTFINNKKLKRKKNYRKGYETY